MDLRLDSISSSEIAQRRALTKFREFITEDYYYMGTTLIKRIKNKGNKTSLISNEIRDLDDKREVDSQLDIVMTHDLDSQACYKYSKLIVEINSSFQIPSTINVLTEGSYRLQDADLDYWFDRKSEIGIHGDNHDLAFFSRSPSEVDQRLKKVIRRLQDYNPRSYRHPGLGHSEVLFEILSANGIQCDSSVPSRYLKPNSSSPTIYQKLEAYRITEIPLTISDDFLFREKNFSDQQALKYVDELSEIVRSEKGALCLNFHPRFLLQNPNFYGELCRLLTQKQNVRFKQLGDFSVER